MGNYNDACTEASIILSFLNIDEYNKIPKNVIQKIERNKNTKYIFSFDENVEIKNQKLLKETKAILFNIFRDYLATPKQRNIIIKMQKEERNKKNEIKKIKYNPNNIFKNNIYSRKENNKINQSNDSIIIKRENVFVKVINKIKNFIRNYNKY